MSDIEPIEEWEVDMDRKSEEFRRAVLEHISLLASASLQAQYERDVPIANVPSELVCGFCDDLFHPKSQLFLDAFTNNEIKDLATLYGLLHVASKRMDVSDLRNVADLQKLPEWRSVMSFSKELEANLGGSDR